MPTVYYLVKALDACFYFRVHQIGKYLQRQHGWKCYVDQIDAVATVEPNGDFNFDRIKPDRLAALEASDLIVVQRATDEGHVKLIKFLKNTLKKPVCYEADDVYLSKHIENWNSGRRYFAPRDEWIRESISLCDFMTVTVPRLKEIYSELNGDIHVLPNYLDFESIDAAEPFGDGNVESSLFAMGRETIEDKESERFLRDHAKTILKNNRQSQTEESVDALLKKNIMFNYPVTGEYYRRRTAGSKIVGWGGSPTHVMDIDIISNPLRSVLNMFNSAHLIMIGLSYMLHALKDSPYLDRVKRWANIMPHDRFWSFNLIGVKDYWKMLKTLKPDVWFAPVARVEFNKNKSPLKVYEALAIGMYPMASDFATYNGVLAPESACDASKARGRLCQYVDGAWTQQIREVLSDDAMRNETIEYNKKWARENIDVAKHIGEWDAVYKRYV